LGFGSTNKRLDAKSLLDAEVNKHQLSLFKRCRGYGKRPLMSALISASLCRISDSSAGNHSPAAGYSA
jgi:hypothetical protein